MLGREFLQLARDCLGGMEARHRRGAIIHAYYALLLESRDVMDRWGFPAPPHQQVHAQVRLRLIYSSDADLKAIGRKLEDLVKDRNLASYNLRDFPLFASPKKAQDSIIAVARMVTLLDAIDGDPTRRAAAIASIRP